MLPLLSRLPRLSPLSRLSSGTAPTSPATRLDADGAEPGAPGTRRRRRRHAFRPLWCLAALLLAGQAGAAVRTVGKGTACDHDTLPEAVAAAAPGDEIRLGPASAAAYSLLELGIYEDLSIIGGYPACTATEPTGRTLLTGTLARGVIEIEEAAVVIRNVVIKSGRGDVGGAINVRWQAGLLLDNVEIANNHALRFGGGLYARDATVVLRDTVIRDNRADESGGGIYCRYCDLRLLGGNQITVNHADLRGGGILGTYANIAIVGPNDIGFNEAIDGGGIDLWQSELTLRDTAEGAPVVRSNRATVAAAAQHGGGILVKGSGSRMVARGVRIESNQVPDHTNSLNCGGGLLVENGASAYVGPGHQMSVIDDNRGGSGAAACVSGEGSLLVLENTTMRRNAGNAGDAYGLVDVQHGGRLEAEGLLIADNDAEKIVRVWDSSSARLAHVTSGLNGGAASLIWLSDRGGAGSAELYSSIVWETGATDIFTPDAGSTIAADCLLTVDDDSVPPMSRHLVSHVPPFVDAEGGDYHLRTDSAAIDFCDASIWSPSTGDLDGGRRGRDQVTSPDRVPGAHIDLGVDEYRSGGGEIILWDDFELGDTSMWG